METELFIFPTSFAQQRLWFLERLEPGKSIYNIVNAISFETRINQQALAQSLDEIGRRHESLRTRFATVDGQPMQIVEREPKFNLQVTDLSGLTRLEQDQAIQRQAEQEGEQPFDLATGPLFRARLLLLAEEQSVLLIAIHHIVIDGWSMGLLFQELAVLYEAFSHNRPSPLPDVRLQYADYAVWQRDWLQGGALRDQVAFWKTLLAGAPAAIDLATDRQRPAVQTFQGARRYAELPADLTDRLRTFSRQEGVTLFMTLLAAFDVLLWRYSGQDDVVVGSPIAGRNRSELEGLIGFFANTLPIRTDLSGNPSFRELLGRVREVALDAYAHQDVPFDRLVEELRPVRSLSHTPLFQVIFALENTPQPVHVQGLGMRWLEVERSTARCDLSLFTSDKGNGLRCLWEYSTDLFDADTIERMRLNYQTILESALDNPAEPISSLQTCAEAEQRQLLVQWNTDRTEPSPGACLHQLFDAQAERTPDSIAVVFAGERLTYRELNARANRLAQYLRTRGVGPETPVGVCLERSATMVIALLAVLKAGGAYVPLDPGYPAERLAFMLEDSRVPMLITERQLLRVLPAVPPRIVVDDCPEIAAGSAANPSSGVTPENLAYIIYTSGSTGRPKGVEVTHRSVAHLFAVTREKLGFREGDVWTVVHSCGFDFSVWEIWGSLVQGGTLVVAPLHVVQSPSEFYDLLCRNGATIVSQTPSALRALLDARREALTHAKKDWNVRLIVCGGDALDTDLAGELIRLAIPVWNFYGPTESTVWTTCGLIEAEGGDLPTSIGRPLADIDVYLLDDRQRLVPIGVPGELLIGGDGLARGYRNRPELTAKTFIPHPFTERPGARLYRTGDLARYRAAGKIEFLGRLDHQVKLRGFRIELGEIETLLSQHQNIAQAVVMVRGDRPDNRKLVAYIVAEGRGPSAEDLRKLLRQSVPEYMVPSAFVMLDAMPLTPNKKVDRRALPAADALTTSAAGLFAEPRNPVEEMLAQIWTNVLGCDRIGIHDNFFERGGHSLLATQVVSRLRDAFQVEVPLRALFESPTVAGLSEILAAIVQAQQGLGAAPLLPASRDRRLPLSFAQQRLWFLDQLEPGNPFYNISRAIRARGALDVDALSQAITEIVRRHESLRTVFRSAQGTPFQIVNAPQDVPLTLIDLPHQSASIREAEAAGLAAERIRQVFDLSRDLLLRATLLRISDDDHVLVITTHHITADGWSLAVLFRELTALYGAIAGGRNSPLVELPIQYADFAVWQREWLQGEVLDRLTAFWRDELAGAPAVLELPADKPRPPVQEFRGAREPLALSPFLADGLKRLSRAEHVTLFMTCLAAFQLLLSRHTGGEDVLVGTDVACRNRVELEGLIGFFTNVLPLRTKLSGNPRFTELLRRVRTTTLNAYAHQDLPFEKIVEELRPPRDRARNPLVQVLLVMQNEAPHDFALPDVQVSWFDLPIESSRFDLVLFLREAGGGLAGMWLYNPDLFEASTIARLSVQYQRLLTAVVRDPSARLNSFELSDGEEAKQKTMEKKEQQQAQVNRLRSMRRKSVDLSQVSGVKSRHLQADQTLPLVIEPDTLDIDLPDWAASNKQFIETNLLKHGAVLFRGFGVESAASFEKVASAICPEMFDEYGDLPREQLGGKVYSSTPYPADETILFHNEGSHQHRWPMWISFYCVKAAKQGGESPIVDCRRVYQAMNPAVRDRFERKGLMYVRNFTEGLDVSWQQFFHTSDRAAVEEYCRNAALEFEWTRNNGLRTCQRCPAVVKHPRTGEIIFFNQVQLHHISCLSPAVRESLLSMVQEEDLPRNVYYGDGSKIEDSVMEDLGSLYRQMAVSFPWHEHDVLMLNNMLVAHSRNPFVGERKIVVALGEVVTQEPIEHSNK